MFILRALQFLYSQGIFAHFRHSSQPNPVLCLLNACYEHGAQPNRYREELADTGHPVRARLDRVKTFDPNYVVAAGPVGTARPTAMSEPAPIL